MANRSEQDMATGSVMQTANQAYLLLGSNIDPEANILQAVKLLNERGRIRSCSRVWETAPVGDPDQANYLNLALLLETDADIDALRNDVIADIEQRLQRIRDPKNINAPRTIDIDISLFNSAVIQANGRSIPDPEILTQAHIAIPLAEIAPCYTHPTERRTLKQIAERFQQSTGMRLREDIALSL